MPPKKTAATATATTATAADSADPPAPSSTEAPVEEKKSGAAAVRKLAAHPSTAIMVKEALKELDSRKGVSYQAIQNYIKQKYPSVDLVKLKHLVRRALKKGIETGTLVRPANSSATTGATGKFRLAPKVKEAKPKTENTDPNVQKVPKAAKDGAKKPKKAGATKKDTAIEQDQSQEESKPPKKSKKDEDAVATTKVAPAKKPKAKKVAEKEDDEEAAKPAVKTKAAKATKEPKAGKASQSKAAKASSEAPAAKATGKRGKKTAE
ncbi:protein B4 [Dicentrarchus labrax]|uniref:H15 domain-containing protein n=1 Tax=Dicentrarchus labrax TaxID=13489 RepID=A0A8P4G039_DICLA|nr:protein B4 [Dicentrarchus labrax]